MDSRHYTYHRHWPRQTQDPVQRLPSELVMLVIQDTLQNDHSARILDLTMVSRTWQAFLFSTPALWSELNIDEREPDLLATLAVFIHFSGKVPLKCVIGNHLIQDWAGVVSLLLPVYQRVTALTVKNTVHNPGLDGAYASLYVASTFLDYLERLPKVTDVVFDKGQDFSQGQLESLNLSPEVRFDCTLTVGFPIPIRYETGNSRFFDVKVYERLDNSPKTLSASISLFFSTTKAMQTIDSRIAVDYRGRLHRLDGILESFANLGNVERLVRAIAFDLSHFDIDIPLPQIADLVDCLGQLESLQELNLKIRIDSTEAVKRIAPPGDAFMGLQRLSVRPYSDGSLPSASGAICDAFSELSAGFIRMYPGIRLFNWRSWLSVDIWHAFSFSYLQSLEWITTLEMEQSGEGASFPKDPVILWSLLDLCVSHLDMCGFFETPNLLRLEIDGNDSEALANVDIQRLRKLVVTDAEDSFIFHEFHFPEVRELELTINGRTVGLIESRLFPQLVSIDIVSFFLATNPPGTLLCVELLYNPDHCPFLQQLRFNLCVEWDILFLMLKRRNFGLNGVKRIHTVDLPFVPFQLRHSLALLLAGEGTEYPPLMHLSREETREVLFDATVEGCAHCLINTIPGCEEAVVRGVIKDLDGAGFNPAQVDICLEFGDPPVTLPAEIQEWMNQRARLVDVWWASYEGFRLMFHRVNICERFD